MAAITQEQLNAAMALPEGPERAAALAELEQALVNGLGDSPDFSSLTTKSSAPASPPRTVGQQALDFPKFISRGLLSPLTGSVGLMDKLGGIAADPGAFAQSMQQGMEPTPDNLSGGARLLPALMGAIGGQAPLSQNPALAGFEQNFGQAFGFTPPTPQGPLGGSEQINSLLGLAPGQVPESFSDKTADLFGMGMGGAGLLGALGRGAGVLESGGRFPGMISQGARPATIPGQVNRAMVESPIGFTAGEALSSGLAQGAMDVGGAIGERAGPFLGATPGEGRTIGETVGAITPATTRAFIAAGARRMAGPRSEKMKNLRFIEMGTFEPTPAWVSPRNFMATTQRAASQSLAGQPIRNYLEAQGRRIAQRLDSLANVIKPPGRSSRGRANVGKAVRLGLFGQGAPNTVGGRESAQVRRLNEGNKYGTVGGITLLQRAETRAWNEWEAALPQGQSSIVIANRSRTMLQQTPENAIPDALRNDEFFSKYLEAMNRGAFVDIQTLKNARTSLGAEIGDPNLSNLGDRTLRRLYGELSDDLRQYAVRVGVGDKFDRATRRTSHLHDVVDRKLKRIADKASEVLDGDIGRRLETLSAEEARLLRKHLAKNEWDIVVANYLQRKFLAPKSRIETDVVEVQGKQESVAGMADVKSFLGGLGDMRRLQPGLYEELFASSRGDIKAVNAALDDLIKASNRIEVSSKSQVSTLFAQMLFKHLISRVVTFSKMKDIILNPKASRWMADLTDLPAKRVPGHIAKAVEIMKGAPAHEQEYIQQLIDQLAARVGQAESAEPGQEFIGGS